MGAEVTIGFRDELGNVGQARELMRDYLMSMAVSGLDLERVDVYLQQDSQAIVRTAFELGEAIPLSVLNSALGLRLRDTVTDTFRPLLRLADILHVQQHDAGGPCRTLVVDGIGGDVYVRMARNVAERFGYLKPSALYLRPLRNLTTYEDPRTGGAVEVMSNRVPPGRITYDDDPADIRRRISRAYTGGRGTLDEQREKGGNPDPRGLLNIQPARLLHLTRPRGVRGAAIAVPRGRVVVWPVQGVCGGPPDRIFAGSPCAAG